MTQQEKLEALKSACLSCKACSIGGKMVSGHPSNVFSNMTLAKYMVVGQNPGAEEVEQGQPFVGISGKMFNQLVEEVLGMKRSDFYITNTVKCFTTGNRKPSAEEIERCRKFLDEEIAIVKPLFIISLGGPALEQLTGMHGIMKHRGDPVFSPRYGLFVFPMLHPSPLNLNDPAKMEMFAEDLGKLKDFMEKMNG